MQSTVLVVSIVLGLLLSIISSSYGLSINTDSLDTVREVEEGNIPGANGEGNTQIQFVNGFKPMGMSHMSASGNVHTMTMSKGLGIEPSGRFRRATLPADSDSMESNKPSASNPKKTKRDLILMPFSETRMRRSDSTVVVAGGNGADASKGGRDGSVQVQVTNKQPSIITSA